MTRQLDGGYRNDGLFFSRGKDYFLQSTLPELPTKWVSFRLESVLLYLRLKRQIS
jgi:hypothetical protein